MKQFLLAAFGSLGVILLSHCSSALAQFNSPYGRFSGSGYSRPPSLSPYLNLLRGGSPAANYYLGVVPYREQRAIDRTLGAVINDLERRSEGRTQPETAEDLIPTLPSSGHAVGYGVYAPFYNFGPQRSGVVGQSPALRRR